MLRHDVEGLNHSRALFCLEFENTPQFPPTVCRHLCVVGCNTPRTAALSRVCTLCRVDGRIPSSSSIERWCQRLHLKTPQSSGANLNCMWWLRMLWPWSSTLGVLWKTPWNARDALMCTTVSVFATQSPVTQWMTKLCLYHAAAHTWNCIKQKDNKRSEWKLPCLNKVFWLTFSWHACWD